MIAWTPAVMCAVWAVIRVPGFERGYPLVPLMTYTPYVVPVAILALAVALGLRQWKAAALAGVAALALVLVVAPRVIGGPDDVDGRPLRVLDANVLKGGGDAAELAELVRNHDADVLTVQELTPEFAARLRAAGIDRQLPHSALSVKDGVIGSGVYSRFPVSPPAPGADSSTRATINVAPGLALDITSVHNLPVPASRGWVRGWASALASLPSPSESGAIGLLVGDFNATLDQSDFRDLLDRGYTDAAEHMGDGLAPTWPALGHGHRYLPVTIDHVLYDSDRVGIRDYDVLDLKRSDHDPIYAELVIRS